MSDETASNSQSAPSTLLAFEALYEKFGSAVFSFACYLTQDKEEAEDLFQETWLRVAKNLPENRRMHSIKAWVFTIVSNLHKDVLRKKRIRRLFRFDESRPGLSEKGDYSGLEKDLFQAIAKLPSRQRRVFVLKEMAGFKQTEIGEILGIPLGTVKSLMFRAVKRLQRELAEYNPNSIDVRESNAM